jgi:O-acetyl-ADP-ribose deacetylase (regulator of RNase III)
MAFKLILSAVQEDLYQAFKKHFAKFPEVEVVFKPFEQVEFDCVVSAANSFGLMDGGVDQAITDYFGLQMMKRVQQEVINQYYGEQPVGTSMIVRGNADLLPEGNKYVAHTPTMRIPMDIHQTRNVYAAMKAMLIAVEQHNQTLWQKGPAGNNQIKTVVCPGLGTNTGRVPAEDAAKQMAMAYYHFKNPPTAISWYFASARHNEIMRVEIEDDGLDKIDLTGFEN